MKHLSVAKLALVALAGCARTVPPVAPTTAPGIHGNEIIASFGQGEAGNCASISVIKLALFSYGYAGTFESVDAAGRHFVLRDGRTVDITDEDLANVRTVAHFEEHPGFDPSTTALATRMLTVMARNRCNKVGCPTTVLGAFDPTDHFLDEDTVTNFGWLGLSGLFQEVTPTPSLNRLQSLDAYIVTNKKHSAFGFGPRYDEHGRIEAITEFEGQHSFFLSRLFGARHINGVFTLKPLPASGPSSTPQAG